MGKDVLVCISLLSKIVLAEEEEEGGKEAKASKDPYQCPDSTTEGTPLIFPIRLDPPRWCPAKNILEVCPEASTLLSNRDHRDHLLEHCLGNSLGLAVAKTLFCIGRNNWTNGFLVQIIILAS